MSDVVLTLSLSEGEISIGDNLVATLNVQNVSARNRPLVFGSAFTHEFVVSRNGSRVDFVQEKNDALFAEREIVGSQALSLQKAFTFDVPGTYLVTARLLADGFDGDLVAEVSVTQS